MPIVVVPEVLREKLGDEGSKALVELLKSVQREAKEDAITLVEERFARRLSEELGKLRKGIYGELNKIWEEIGNLRGGVLQGDGETPGRTDGEDRADQKRADGES